MYRANDLFEAIHSGEIKDNSKISVMYDGDIVEIIEYKGGELRWKPGGKFSTKYLCDIDTEFEVIEDEIDIDSIENINAYKLPENETDFIQMAEVERLFYWKIDELIKAIKQQQREIDKLKED